MSDEANTPEEETQEGKTSPFMAGLRVLGGAALLLLAAYATAAAIFLAVPESNDYSLGSGLKHDRLESLDSPKIVLVGGSNLAFGIDSAMIQEATGCPVVNMGMNGYFGIRFMQSEVRPSIREGDIVVQAFELDNFFKSVDGTATNLMVVAKWNPRVWNYLTPRQQLAILERVPYAAQFKILRISREAVDVLRVMLTGPDEGSYGRDLVTSIESFEGFNQYGDLESHLGVPWTEEREQGIVSADASGIETQAIDLLQEFSVEMEARGAHVLTSYTPVLQDFYVEHEALLTELHRQIAGRAGIHAPSSISRFVFPSEDFFDTVYHLDAEGRAMRTQRLIEDLRAQFGEAVQCDGAQLVVQQDGPGFRAQ